MNARFVARPLASASRSLAARQLAQPVARRFASSEAMGQELVHERDHAKDHAGKSADMWRKVSVYGCIPFAIVMGVYIYQIEAAHIHHRDHEIAENGGELPETTKYEYNDIRKKPFPWHNKDEGKDNSFFFNPKANRDVGM
ncbi:hypothetical protein FA10DRAFT_267919 [Acaromyces ingoldii]|uniref:Mitochondrial cytochrome c oxidase subunit VIa n=1 Tax=Acaromyces ingoldii TaxID=215250 RepID=A0A316YMQ1_9BASI|nr:hypothetical protein FA10DRAFT_267919 [Acaromyces ingoldii]PWN89343.1 hypothetical protein FA10DRAFT_267919 [Acaromyces ingoldii]